MYKSYQNLTEKNRIIFCDLNNDADKTINNTNNLFNLQIRNKKQLEDLNLETENLKKEFEKCCSETEIKVIDL